MYMDHTPMANPTEEGEPGKRLLACHDTWLELKIMPAPSVDAAITLCPHILSQGNTIVTAPNAKIYIISPHGCSCGAEKAVLYLFSPDDNSLIPITTSGERISVPYVYGSGMITGGDGRVVLVAGSDLNDGVDLHVYSLDLKTKQWTRVTANGPAPCKRSWFTAVLVGSKFFIYGGWDSLRGFDDIWTLDFERTTPTWQYIEPSTSMRPTMRGGHICVHNDTHLIIFGGWSENSDRLNATWAFDLEAKNWEYLQCSGSIPSIRCQHAGVLVGNVIYVFGGQTLSDFWALDLSKRQWHTLSTGGSAPGTLERHAMLYLRGRIYIFGGKHTVGSIDPRNILHSFDIASIPNADLQKQSQAQQHKDDIPPPQYSRVGLVSQHDPDSSSLSSLLVFLRTRKLGDPISSMVNATSVDLMRDLLRLNNHVSLSLQLDAPSEIEALVELALFLLNNGCLPNAAVPDANRRARRLMQNLIVEWQFVPKSLFLSGVEISSDQDAQWEGLGNMIRGDFQGKVVVLKFLPPTPSKDFYRELLTWRSVHHKNVLPILGIHEEKLRRRIRYLVIPVMENGTLSRWRREKNPSVKEIQKLILQVAEGLRYLHFEGVVHGDVRGCNIWLDSAFNTKIANFVMLQTETMSGHVQSANFVAPELFSGWDDDELSDSDSDISSDIRIAARTKKSDIYAFGCLYYEIHFGTIPFDNVPYDQLVTFVTKDQKRPDRLEAPALSKEAWTLIRRCWRPDPLRRPAMEDIVDKMADWDSN